MPRTNMAHCARAAVHKMCLVLFFATKFIVMMITLLALLQQQQENAIMAQDKTYYILSFNVFYRQNWLAKIVGMYTL